MNNLRLCIDEYSKLVIPEHLNFLVINLIELNLVLSF